MKSRLVSLIRELLLDVGAQCGAPVAKDFEVLCHRVENEGDSFLTITLPSFASDFEQSLAFGRIAPGAFLSFRKERSGIPSFLKGFLCNVFDAAGVLLPCPSVSCIRAVRQVCLFFKKLLRDCSNERQKKASEGYRSCDQDVLDPFGQHVETFLKVADVVFSTFDVVDGSLLDLLVPAHGPGATQEGISGNQKWVFQRWNERLEMEGFTFQRFGKGSAMTPDESLSVRPEFVTAWDEEPARVCLVPKTLKSPRLIAVEPVVMQYAQQGLSRWLVSQIENCEFTRNRVNFRNQGVNQRLALESSRDGRMATLDMSDASDRISSKLVFDMLRACPQFRRLAFACRSTRARLPEGDVISLNKFASMGSALCFPIESMVFFLSIIALRLRQRRQAVTRHSVLQMGRNVYVYGDDLIVPAHEAPAICDGLESFGFKVNKRKSFWTGQFRESCGSDCFAGSDVTPTYFRRDIPANRGDVSGILSLVACANQLFSKGLHRTSAAIRKAVEELTGYLPHVPENSPAVGWHNYSERAPRARWNEALQRTEYLCLVPIQGRMPDPLDGDPALAKCFRVIGHESIAEDHLTTSPRPYSLALKRRWVTLYH